MQSQQIEAREQKEITMSSKRKAEKAAASPSGGAPKFKQTRLNFGRSGGASGSRPQQQQEPPRQRTKEETEAYQPPPPRRQLTKEENRDVCHLLSAMIGRKIIPAWDGPAEEDIAPGTSSVNNNTSIPSETEHDIARMFGYKIRPAENKPVEEDTTPGTSSGSNNNVPPASNPSNSSTGASSGSNNIGLPSSASTLPTTTKNPAPPPKTGTKLLRITDKVGNLFDAPPNTVLIHACNCVGSWGGGIALAFKQQYPKAFNHYAEFCKQPPDELIAGALLIPPQGGPNTKEGRKQHYIGCLFTSRRYGRARDSPDDILANTNPAMKGLLQQIAEDGGVTEVRMCQINSGLFGVPWTDTKKLLEEMKFKEEDEEYSGFACLGELELPLDVVAYSRE
ncbi:hypothetical protein B0H66DRAFT_563524 [Apodospora peruviana]|uniref:ADP-ribose 1''-phosphate phosphatase n=1 Tax=Apodospora peruviana TaxID=516989 RepID=A0AAE0M0S7_9PEZI|nr:hypothetical protein B0H66DRAFT_563524 [Apodospora peruviana]